MNRNSNIHHSILYPVMTSQYLYPMIDETMIPLDLNKPLFYQILNLIISEETGLSHMIVPFIKKYHKKDEFEESVEILDEYKKRLIYAFMYLCDLYEGNQYDNSTKPMIMYPQFLNAIPKKSPIFQTSHYLKLYSKIMEIKKIFGVHLFVTKRDFKQQIVSGQVETEEELRDLLCKMAQVCEWIASFLKTSNIPFVLGGSFSLYLQKKFRCSNDLDFVFLRVITKTERRLVTEYMIDMGFELSLSDDQGIGFVSSKHRFSVDFDINQHYNQPLSFHLEPMIIKLGEIQLSVLHEEVILNYKKRYGRLKDIGFIYYLLKDEKFRVFMKEQD